MPSSHPAYKLVFGLVVLLTGAWPAVGAPGAGAPEVKPLAQKLAREYKLNTDFYTRSTMVQNVLIATSSRVSDHAHLEAAYQFDMIMKSIDAKVARRIRDRGVLCLLIGHKEFTSDLPQFASDKKGKDLDFYNWRQRGFLGWKGGRPRWSSPRRTCLNTRAACRSRVFSSTSSPTSSTGRGSTRHCRTA